MTKGKTIIVRLVLAVVVLVVVVLGGLQYVLQNRLNDVFAEVLPALKAEKGVDVSIGNASVNAFGGSALIEGLQIANMGAGYGSGQAATIDSLSIELGLLNLIKGTLNADRLELQDFDFNLIRNADNRLNVNDLSSAVIGRDVIPMPTIKGVVSDVGDSVPEPIAEAPAAVVVEEASEPMPIRIGSLSINGQLEYIDYRIVEEVALVTGKPAGDPFRLAMDLSTRLENIHYLQGGEWGTIRITGNLAGKVDVIKVDLSGDIGPITDPDKIDLKLQGTISEVDLKLFEVFGAGEDPPMTSEHPGEIQVNLESVAGQVNAGVSRVVLRFKDVLLSEKLEKKYHVARLPYITIPMELSGPLNSMKLEKPKTGDVIIASILESAGDEAVKQELKDKASEAIMKSDKLDKYLDEDDKKKLNKALQGLF